MIKKIVMMLVLVSGVMPMRALCDEGTKTPNSVMATNVDAKIDAALERIRTAWATNCLAACEESTNINAIVRSIDNLETRRKYAIRYAEFVVSLDGKRDKVRDSSLVFCRREMLMYAFQMMDRSKQTADMQKNILKRFREVLESERKWYVDAADINQAGFSSQTNGASLRIISPPPDGEKEFQDWKAKRQKESHESRRKKSLRHHAEFLKGEIEEVNRFYDDLCSRYPDTPTLQEARKPQNVGAPDDWRIPMSNLVTSPAPPPTP